MTLGRHVQRMRTCASRLATCVATDRRMVGELIAWRISLPVLKRFISVETLVKRMAPRTPSPADRRRPDRIDVIRRVVGTGGRLIVSANCLERSLVLYRLLSHAGAEPTLVLGVRRDGSSLKGHAWVALDGAPFEVSKDEFTPVVTFGSSPGTRGRAGTFPLDVLPPF